MLRKITAFMLAAATAVCAYNANVMAYENDGDDLSVDTSSAETSDSTKVCIWFKNDDYSSYTEEQAWALAREYEETLDSSEYTSREIEKLRTDYYRAKKLELLKAANLERAYQILDELRIDREKAFCSNYAPMIVCELTNEQIETAQAMDYVSEISIYEPLEMAEDAMQPTELPTVAPWIDTTEYTTTILSDGLLTDDIQTQIYNTTTEPYTEFTTNLTDDTVSELSIYIRTLPDKTVYNIGEELDLTGGVYDVYEKVTLPNGHEMWADMFLQEMTDGSKKMNGFYPLDLTIDTHEFDNTKAGVYTVYLTAANEQSSYTKDFTVTVLESGEDSIPEKESDILGDANGDFSVTISDSVMILQNIANAEKYPLTEQQKINADCYNTGDGITGMDAKYIQMLDAGMIDSLS